jgi:hypothetical protein
MLTNLHALHKTARSCKDWPSAVPTPEVRMIMEILLEMRSKQTCQLKSLEGEKKIKEKKKQNVLTGFPEN